MLQLLESLELARLTIGLRYHPQRSKVKQTDQCFDSQALSLSQAFFLKIETFYFLVPLTAGSTSSSFGRIWAQSTC